MAADFTGISINEQRLNNALHDFMAAMPEHSEAAVKKVGFDVVASTQKLMLGFRGLPKRVHTGRDRAGWRVAFMMIDSRLAATLQSSPNSEPGDGDAHISPKRHGATMTVANNVDYSVWVELGTATMAAGLHLTTSLRQVATDLEGSLRDWRKDLRDGFYGR